MKMFETMNVKCYRVNTLWHLRRANFLKPEIFKVDLGNLMALRGETHETMLSIVRYHESHNKPIEALCVNAFYHTYGQSVKVVRGRKIPIGTVGECFWMGYKPYGYIRGGSDEVSKALRIGIRDAAGEVYWTTLNNVEVIAEFEHEAAIPEHLYSFPRKFLDLPSLYGEDETDALKAVREELEQLHKKYALQRELVEISRVNCEKVEIQLGKDNPETYAAWDEYDAIFFSCSELQNELNAITNKYIELWCRDISPLVEISSKGAAYRN